MTFHCSRDNIFVYLYQWEFGKVVHDFFSLFLSQQCSPNFAQGDVKFLQNLRAQYKIPVAAKIMDQLFCDGAFYWFTVVKSINQYIGIKKGSIVHATLPESTCARHCYIVTVQLVAGCDGLSADSVCDQ